MKMVLFHEENITVDTDILEDHFQESESTEKGKEQSDRKI